MKRTFVMMVIFCLCLAGCGDDGNGGGGSGQLAVGNSGAFTTETIEASNADKTWHLTEIYASSHADICGTFDSACGEVDAGANTQILNLTLFADEELETGTYTIGDFDEEDTPSDSLVAVVVATGVSGAQGPATSGTVEVESFDAQSLSGTYQLTFNGGTFTGSFSADQCQSLRDYRDTCG